MAAWNTHRVTHRPSELKVTSDSNEVERQMAALNTYYPSVISELESCMKHG